MSDSLDQEYFDYLEDIETDLSLEDWDNLESEYDSDSGDLLDEMV